MHHVNITRRAGNSSPDFCTGSCPAYDSRTNAIEEQQLKQTKPLVHITYTTFLLSLGIVLLKLVQGVPIYQPPLVIIWHPYYRVLHVNPPTKVDVYI